MFWSKGKIKVPLGARLVHKQIDF